MMLRKVLLICVFGWCFPFKLKCPSESQWSLRARAFCPSDPSKYSCIQNDLTGGFTEDCSVVEFERGGTKTILRGNFDAGPCSKDRYQPGHMKYSTNVSSGCVFAKSLCSEEGQILFDQGSPTQDVECRCDYTENYDFIFRQNNSRYCKPSEEDCACFKKQCLTNYVLSSDYACILTPAITNEPLLDKPRNETEILLIPQSNITKRERFHLPTRTAILLILILIIVVFLGPFCHDKELDKLIDQHVRKVYFVRNLEEEVKGIEGKSEKITCELSKKDVAVQWLKDGTPIQFPCTRFIKDSGGRYYTLMISDLKMEDDGVITLKAGNRLSQGLKLKVLPYFTTNLKPLTSTEGQTVFIEFQTVENISDVTCIWFFNDNEINDSEKYLTRQSGVDCQLTIKEVKPIDSGEYQIRIRNISRRTELKVQSYFKADLRPIPCVEGGECLLECEVTGNNNMPAIWFKDGNQIDTSERVLISMNGTKHQLKILNVKSDDRGDYKITVNNVSRQADVKVIDLFSKPLTNTSCMEGLRAVLICEVVDKQINAKWSKDGIPIGENSDIFVQSSDGIHKLCINQTDKNSEGQYQINVGNRNSSAYLKVTAMPDFIRRMPLEDRERYLRTAKDGTMKRRHIRIMIVGKYSAGKTCLMRRLLNEEINDVISTDGINVEVRRCKVRISDGQWIFSEEKCYKQDFDGKFKNALSAKIHDYSNPKPLVSANIEQLDYISIHSNATDQSLNKDKTTPVVEENISLKSRKQDSKDIQTAELVAPKRCHTLTEVKGDFSHNVFQQDSKLLDENEMKSMKETSIRTMSIQKSNDFEQNRTNKSNTEQTTELKIKPLHELQPKQIHTDESIENKETDQLYLLSNVLQSEGNTDNIECAECDFWDFAGQRDFYATHQTFLTMNAIYLLTIDLSSFETAQPVQQEGGKLDDIGEYTNYWLDCIHCYSTQNRKEKMEEREPPVIIVCTGIDKVTDFHKVTKSFKHHLEENVGSHPKRFHIRDIVYLSNKDKDKNKFDILRSKIWKTVKSMSSWEDELPLSWIHLEKQLQVKSDKENIVSLEDVMKIGRESTFPVTNEEDVISFLRVQHEMGNIIFFHRLREYIILNPVWLVDAFRCLVSPCEFQQHHLDIDNLNQIADTGEIMIDYIEQMFTKVPKLNFFKHKDHLLKVMEEFDIIVRPKTRRPLSFQQGYYIPCLIKYGTFATVSDNFGVNKNNCQRTPWVCLEFDFLPPAFFNHILVHLIRIYHVSEADVKSRLALYSSFGVFDLNKSATSKLVLCTANDTIAFQVWQWLRDRSQFVYLRTKIEEIVDDVIKRYRMDIKYDVKYKCKTGTFSKQMGRKTASELSQLKKYCCSEHNENHEAKEIIDVWIEQQKSKGFPEETIDREWNKQIKCKSCGLVAVYWCENCEKAMCEVCNEKHTLASTQHTVVNVLDKYILKNQFVVDKASICDIKMLSETLLVADFIGKQLILYNTNGIDQRTVPLSKGPRKIAIVDNKRVAVRLFRDSKVVIVDLYQSGIFEIDIKEKCHGIMYMNNKLFVGCDDNTLRVFDLNGEKIKTIDMPFKPWYICSDSENRILCTEEYNANKVSCFDQDGNELFIISNNYMVGVAGITVDDNGFILVSCKNSHNVHRINPNDKKSEIIISKIPGLSTDWFPYICFDSQSESVIIAREDKVYVYAKQMDL
ncbi:uncharacterized protein LOC127719609 [Mytilus californianus]|uniref:uncharacterized protein LOC127719609 n=1 Tax=Mytilus californianus TaxID=6549 RepID=UPI0022455853|nr:uncharacterized protein LOC127719609 [Mytilus californianus]